MTEGSPGGNKGLLKSLTAFVTTLIAMAHTRLELLSIDMEQERDHLFTLMILILSGLFSLGVGVVLASMAIIVMYWDSHRLLALGILTSIFLAVALLMGILALYKVRSRPRMLAATLLELAKDRQQTGNPR